MENENFKNESRWGSVKFSFYRYANYFLENKESTNKSSIEPISLFVGYVFALKCVLKNA